MRQQNGDADPIIRDVEIAMGIINQKLKYQKWKVICGWLQNIGYKSLFDTKEITQKDMKMKVAEVYKNISEKDKIILGVKKSVIFDSTKFRTQTQVINGRLNSEFGVSIKKTNKNSKNSELPYV